MKTKQKIIYSSKDYSKFVQDDTNRSASNHPKLLASMQQHGWLPEHPAIVIPDDGKLRIKDGGHRITIAQKLGLLVYYVITENDEVSIPQINEAQKRWNNGDYVSAFIKQGRTEYAKLVAFSDANGIPLGISAGILNGNKSTASMVIKSGKFKACNEAHAQSVISVVKAAEPIVKWAKTARFVNAVSSVLRYSQASPKTLCEKIRSHGGMLVPQTTVEGFIEMLQNIYNYKSRELMGISLAVKQGIRANQQENASKLNTNRK